MKCYCPSCEEESFAKCFDEGISTFDSKHSRLIIATKCCNVEALHPITKKVITLRDYFSNKELERNNL